MADVNTETQLYRKGLGLREQVQEPLRRDYQGLIVDFARERNYKLVAGELTFRLAKELGFCYGVDRAVELLKADAADSPSPPDVRDARQGGPQHHGVPEKSSCQSCS